MILIRDAQFLAETGQGPGPTSQGQAGASGVDPEALPRPRVLTTGVFDGLHRAHERLIRRVVDAAHATEDSPEKGTAIFLTFSNHPLTALAPPYVPKMLLGPDRKAELLEELGIDLLIMPEFTAEFAAIGAERFLREVLAGQLGIDRLVVGFDFRFGKDGEGDTALLREKAPEFGIELEVLPAIYHHERTISSTHIRELRDTGRVRLAGEMLGRPHELPGKVAHGYGRGTDLGFPTANLVFDPAFAIPPSGVYAVLVRAGERLYQGMMNIGSSPTFAGTEYRPEVFLLDYEKGDLYEEMLRVFFIERLREERKFESAHALQERLKVDEKLARAILDSHPIWIDRRKPARS